MRRRVGGAAIRGTDRFVTPARRRERYARLMEDVIASAEMHLRRRGAEAVLPLRVVPVRSDDGIGVRIHVAAGGGDGDGAYRYAVDPEGEPDEAAWRLAEAMARSPEAVERMAWTARDARRQLEVETVLWSDGMALHHVAIVELYGSLHMSAEITMMQFDLALGRDRVIGSSAKKMLSAVRKARKEHDTRRRRAAELVRRGCDLLVDSTLLAVAEACGLAVERVVELIGDGRLLEFWPGREGCPFSVVEFSLADGALSAQAHFRGGVATLYRSFILMDHRYPLPTSVAATARGRALGEIIDLGPTLGSLVMRSVQLRADGTIDLINLDVRRQPLKLAPAVGD